MKTRAIAILLLLLGGCAQGGKLIQPLARDVMLLSSQAELEPNAASDPRWPTITLTNLFSGLDANLTYPDQWTNFWRCLALASMDATQPLAQWTQLGEVTLKHYGKNLGFEVTSNAPWLSVAAEYQPK